MDEKYHMCHQNIALIWALEYHFFSQKQNGLNLLEIFLSAASYFEMKYDKSSKIDNMCTRLYFDLILIFFTIKYP